MKVRKVMTRGVECIDPDDSIQVAAQKMRDLDVGPLPVCEDGRLTGMVTDRDIVVRAVCDGCDTMTTTVREVMTPGIVYCFDDQKAEEAAEIMRKKRIRRLPVLNRDKRLVGIVTLGDLAVETHDEQLAGATLEEVSQPVLF